MLFQKNAICLRHLLDLFEDSDDSLLNLDYFDKDEVDSSTSRSDFDFPFTSGQAHYKRRLLRTLVHIATAATDNHNTVLEVRDAETSGVQACNVRHGMAWKKMEKKWKKNKAWKKISGNWLETGANSISIHFCISPENFVFIICVLMKLPLLKMNSVTVGRKWKETGEATKLAPACISGWSNCQVQLRRCFCFLTLVVDRIEIKM